jgi:hypothetical protein
MFGTDYGAGYGYPEYSYMDSAGDDHTHFLVWLIVFALAATAILGGLRVGGFHFVVKV